MSATIEVQRTRKQNLINGIDWYHTIDLGDGVITPGVFDHSSVQSSYPLPARLDGLRVLDVATFDGYWAFEMERRGAAEVVAIDVKRKADLDLPPHVRKRMSREELDSPAGHGFPIAHEILGSKVRREFLSVYDLSPERLGKFDVVHVGSLLLHLWNPLKALANVCSVTRQYVVIADTYSRKLPSNVMRYTRGADHCAWWVFSYSTLREMIGDAGFENVELKSKFRVRHIPTNRFMSHAGFHARP